ncbi:MAG: DEAD/DEAH box helicase [Actinobacteria bacterium]|nr:DEAD/DEAH box helicase [Actinomycetota bacterium]
MSFQNLGVSAALVRTLTQNGITAPFPIQSASLPDAISGRDILGRGQTGSGKTLAFGLALLTRLADRKALANKPLALILSPTRELAMQITDVIGDLAPVVGLNAQVVAGGLSYHKQQQALRRGVAIVVATPGRLMDLMERKDVILSDVEITVLDEADQMADMGFLPSVREILNKTKADGQRMLFSATLDRDVDSLVKKYLNDPATHSVQNETASVTKMSHHVLVHEANHKDEITSQIAARDGRTIFFVRTKRGADKLTEKLLRAGVKVGALHGGKTQAVRTRTLEHFKNGKTLALVATDVAARGIHVDDVSLVVHVDAPADHKDYLHRAGRTARAGEKGTVVSLVTMSQRGELKRITEKAGIRPTTTSVLPGDSELIKITGSRQPSGVPIVTTVTKSDSVQPNFPKRNRPSKARRTSNARSESRGENTRSESPRSSSSRSTTPRSEGGRSNSGPRKYGTDRGAAGKPKSRTGERRRAR